MSNYPEKLTDGYYYVRKTFEDKESQLARYRVLGNAKTKAEENPGYCVFAEDGTCVYPETEQIAVEEETVNQEEAVADAAEENVQNTDGAYRLLTPHECAQTAFFECGEGWDAPGGYHCSGCCCRK